MASSNCWCTLINATLDAHINCNNRWSISALSFNGQLGMGIKSCHCQQSPCVQRQNCDGTFKTFIAIAWNNLVVTLFCTIPIILLLNTLLVSWFQIILTVLLLYLQLGYSALIGISIIIVLTPLQYYIAKKFLSIQQITMECTDDRIKKSHEMLQNMKVMTAIFGEYNCIPVWIWKKNC